MPQSRSHGNLIKMPLVGRVGRVGRRVAFLKGGVLTLGELEALAGTRLSGFFALFHAGISSEKAFLLEGGPEIWIDLDEGAGNREANRSDLANDAAAVGVHVQVKLLELVGREEGEEHAVLLRDRRKVFVVGLVVDGDHTATGLHLDTSHGGPSPAGGCCYVVVAHDLFIWQAGLAGLNSGGLAGPNSGGGFV